MFNKSASEKASPSAKKAKHDFKTIKQEKKTEITGKENYVSASKGKSAYGQVVKILSLKGS